MSIPAAAVMMQGLKQPSTFKDLLTLHVSVLTRCCVSDDNNCLQASKSGIAGVLLRMVCVAAHAVLLRNFKTCAAAHAVLLRNVKTCVAAHAVLLYVCRGQGGCRAGQ
jgi:hypothetical protein